MRLLLFYWLYGLTCIAAARVPPTSSVNPLRLDSSNTDATFANTDGRGRVQASTDFTDVVMNNNNDTASRLMELNNSYLETNGKETQHRNDKINPFKTIVHEEQIYDVKKGKRESFHKAKANRNVGNDPNNYLQYNVMPLPTNNPFGLIKLPQHLRKKRKSHLFPHKDHRSRNLELFGSSGHFELDDSPESIVLQILSSNQNENNDGFKNVGLTKTVAYNVTRLLDSNQTNNFLLEKKENLTVEMSYLDSHNRETNYSNTQSSKIHKVLGPKLFYNKWASEEDIKANVDDPDIILSNRNVENTRSSNKKSSIAIDPIQKYRSEFIDGNFVNVGYKDFNDSPSEDKKSQLVTGDENESGDLLGQPNGVNNVYPSTLMTEMTMKDFQNLIENIIVNKSYTEIPIATTFEGLEDKGDLAVSSDESSLSQHKEELSTEGVSRSPYPTRILKTNLQDENIGNKDFTEPGQQNRDTTLSTSENKLNYSSYSQPLTIKHGESIVLDGPNYDGVTDTSLTSNQNYANPIISSPAEDVGNTNYSNRLQAREEFNQNENIEGENEDSGFEEYPQISILQKDTQTEETASNVMVVKKGEMETSGFEESDDSTTRNITQSKDTPLSEPIITVKVSTSDNPIYESVEETMGDVNKTAIEKDQILGKESTAFHPEHTPLSVSEPIITVKVSTSDDPIYESVEETMGDVNKTAIEKGQILGKESTAFHPEHTPLSVSEPMGDLNKTVIEKVQILGKESTAFHPEHTPVSVTEPIITYKVSDIGDRMYESVEETTGALNKTAIEKGQIFGKESTAFHPEHTPVSVTEPIITYKVSDSGDQMYENVEETTRDVNKTAIEKGQNLDKESTTFHPEHTPVSVTEPIITVSNSGNDIYESVEETSEDVTGDFSNVDPSKIKLEDNHLTASRQRGDTDIDIQGSTLDNEIEGEDESGHPSHEVQLFGGQEKGQRYNNNTEFNQSKSNPVIDYNNTGLEEATGEPLTELCFPLTNENEVSLWDLIAGKIYVENEGKKILLKLNNEPMNKCHSGTIKCKLPIDFENSIESVKRTDSLQGGEDEDEYFAKVIKRHVIKNKSVQKREVEEVGLLSREHKLIDHDQTETIGTRKDPITKQISLTDLLLVLLTNETSYNSGIKICDTQATKNAAKVPHLGQEIKPVHPTPEDDNNRPTQSNLTMITNQKLINKLGKDQIVQTVKTQNTALSDISEREGSGKRFKRTLVQQEEKEGGCGCGSKLGRTLPPIPNHDHFLGKRLNIITSIAHAIKDWAINSPTH